MFHQLKEGEATRMMNDEKLCDSCTFNFMMHDKKSECYDCNGKKKYLDESKRTAYHDILRYISGKHLRASLGKEKFFVGRKTLMKIISDHEHKFCDNAMEEEELNAVVESLMEYFHSDDFWKKVHDYDVIWLPEVEKILNENCWEKCNVVVINGMKKHRCKEIAKLQVGKEVKELRCDLQERHYGEHRYKKVNDDGFTIFWKKGVETILL